MIDFLLAFDAIAGLLTFDLDRSELQKMISNDSGYYFTRWMIQSQTIYFCSLCGSKLQTPHPL
jgi:hypothetical protein